MVYLRVSFISNEEKGQIKKKKIKKSEIFRTFTGSCRITKKHVPYNREQKKGEKKHLASRVIIVTWRFCKEK